MVGGAPWYGKTANPRTTPEADGVRAAARIDHRVAEHGSRRTRGGKDRAAVYAASRRVVEPDALSAPSAGARGAVGHVDEARVTHGARLRLLRRRVGARHHGSRGFAPSDRPVRSDSSTTRVGCSHAPAAGSTSTFGPLLAASSAWSRFAARLLPLAPADERERSGALLRPSHGCGSYVGAHERPRWPRMWLLVGNLSPLSPDRGVVMAVKRVGIVGSGIMGAGLAEVAARAGFEVVVRSRSATPPRRWSP